MNSLKKTNQQPRLRKHDLYSILGIDRNARNADIRSAYKSQAFRFHPDRNDSETAEDDFKLIKEAYETLSDSGRRKIYDETGEIMTDGKEAKLDASAKQAIQAIFQALLDNHDDSVVDYVSEARKALKNKIATTMASNSKSQGKIKKLNKLIKKTKGKLFVEVLQNKKKHHEQQVEAGEEVIEVAKRAIPLIDEYSIEIDEADTQAGFGQFFSGTATGTVFYSGR